MKTRRGILFAHTVRLIHSLRWCYFKELEKKHPNAESIFMTLDNARYYKNALIDEY